MALFEDKCYGCICDECGEHYESSLAGFSIFCDEEELREHLSEDEWYYIDGKWYCQKCFEKLFEEDEDGKIHYKPHALEEIKRKLKKKKIEQCQRK